MIELGFQKSAGSFCHPATPFTVDFPRGPLAIGDEEVTQWSTVERHGMMLHILTPTDCVRDRLAWFMQPRTDYSALEQALAVATRHPVDIEGIKRWRVREGEAAKFGLFKHRYDEAPMNPSRLL